MQLASSFPGLTHTIEGIIHDHDLPSERVRVHYMVFHDLGSSTDVYDALIADLQESRRLLVEYQSRPVGPVTIL